jgi:hypothetical protein
LGSVEAKSQAERSDSWSGTESFLLFFYKWLDCLVWLSPTLPIMLRNAAMPGK